MGLEKDNHKYSDSIFNTPDTSYPTVPIVPKDVPLPSRESSPKIADEIFEKLIKKPLNKAAEKQYKNQIGKMVKENEEIFAIFIKYGCMMTMAEDGVIIEYPPFKLSGKVTIKENEPAVFDDGAMAIFQQLAKLIAHNDKIEDFVNSYEEQGYYPVGDLEKETVVYKGQNVEVLKGVLANPDKKLKKYVYFYKGREITPDK